MAMEWFRLTLIMVALRLCICICICLFICICIWQMTMEWFRLTLIMVALRRNHVRWWILITDRAIICSIDTAPVPDTCMTPSPVSGVQISPRSVQVYTVQVYTYMTHDTYDTYMTPSPVSGVQISPRVTKKSKFKFFFRTLSYKWKEWDKFIWGMSTLSIVLYDGGKMAGGISAIVWFLWKKKFDTYCSALSAFVRRDMAHILHLSL